MNHNRHCPNHTKMFISDDEQTYACGCKVDKPNTHLVKEAP